MYQIDDLIAAAREGLSVDIEQILRENPQLLHAVNDKGESPLISALYHGKQAVVQQLLELGAAISLHEAAALGDTETVHSLLTEHHVPISEVSFDGWTALHLAAFFGSYETAEYLIKHGADVNAVSSNEQHNRPIHAATAGRKYPLVQLLLEHGADPNVQQQGGWTPLMQAVQNFDSEMVQLLLQYHADAMLENEAGKSAIQLAEENEYEQLLHLLQRK